MTSLTTRLVLLLTLTIALTLTAVTAADYLTSRDRILQQQEQQVEATVAAAVRDLEVRLSVLEETTHLLAEVVEQGDYSEDELMVLLREAVDERDDLFGAALALHPRFASDQAEGFAPYYYYHDGEITYVNMALGPDYMLSNWFRDPLSSGRAVWTEPYYDASGGNINMVTYSVPMYREVGGQRFLYGVVTADITLDGLQYYLQRMKLGKRGFGFMLSRSGKVMASPEPGDWLQPWTRTISSPGEAERWAALVSRVTAGEAASAVVGCLDGPDSCVVKLAPLESTRWPVGAYYAEREILAPLRDYLTKSVLSQLLTLVLLLVGVTVVSRRITRPLTSLAHATGDIATGNFHSPLPETKSRDELGQLVSSFSLMQDRLQDYVDKLQAETASRNRLEGELEAATAIQMSMLPFGGQARVVEDRFKLWANLRPAKSVGGDFYSFHSECNGRLFIAVGDVSDKGVPAALFMARAMTLLQQYVFSSLSAADILAALNDQLVEGNENYMFVTLFVGWLDLDSLQLSFASGGHTPPALSRDGQANELAQESGPALGLEEGQVFPLNAVQLEPGDQVAIFTDGIDEAFDIDGRQFGLEAVQQILGQYSGQSLEAVGTALLDAVDHHQAAVQQSDDITLLLLEPRKPGSARTRITLTDDPGAVSTLQAWMRQLMDEAEIGPAMQAEMQLVAEEVVTNVFKYGELAEGDGVTLKLEISDTRMRMEFCDRGIAFDPLEQARRSDLGSDIESAAIGGLGVHLFQGLTDEQRYQRVDGENRLLLVKYLKNS